MNAAQLYQPELFECKTIADNFRRFHQDNPQVYKWFKHYAVILWNRGYRRYSSDGILHIIRYRVAIRKDPREQFKINNNYSALYARMLINDDVRFNDFFELRSRKSL